MPVGSDICAAREGIVIRVVDSYDGNGTMRPNNEIGIQHDDGTVGWYLHIKRGGASVRKGDRVLRGQRIAASGNVGRSVAPHLHFHVTIKDGDYLPTSFADVRADRGIPRMLKSYTSGNIGPQR